MEAKNLIKMSPSASLDLHHGTNLWKANLRPCTLVLKCVSLGFVVCL